MENKLKPVYVDVHCHIDLYKDVGKIIEEAMKNGVGLIINNGMTPEINRKTIDISERFPNVLSAIGLYPNECKDMSDIGIEEEISYIREKSDKIIAIGEVGIDLKENKNLGFQKEIFEKFIDLSFEIDRPLIVHSRKAEKEVIDILEKNGCKKVIMHCFCGDMKLVDRIIKNGWYLSIPANITNSEQFQKVVSKVPITQLFCETDSPFLHPEKDVSSKGSEYLIPELDYWDKKIEGNSPMNVVYSYKKIAEIKKISLDECREKIFENFLRVFMGE
ncbi:TatD family hydrolase [Candidatus Pacearchaeota archaeon]|nr:TatD family hydrolase [Candidatus Pacearchaeota archaeon]